MIQRCPGVLARTLALGLALGLTSLFTLATASLAQPGSDIHLARFDLVQPVPRIGHLLNVSNRTGYDNQPTFDTRGASLFFAAIDSSSQSDIYRFDLATQGMHRLTRTPESEFSPTLTPAGNALSAVRVDLDGEQRLWKIGLDGVPLAPLLSATRIGYHAWIDPRTVALFLVGDAERAEPHRLAFADLETGALTVVLDDPGRCLRALPGVGVLTIQGRATSVVAADPGPADTTTVATTAREAGEPRRENEPWLICVDLEGTVHPVLRAIDGGQDFDLLPDGRVLLTAGSKFFVTNESVADVPNLPAELQPSLRWRPCLDVSRYIPGPLSRVAVSPDGRWLAVVAEEAQP